MSQDYLQSDKLSGNVYDMKLMRRMMPFLRAYWHFGFGALLLVFGGMILQLVNPYLLGLVVDEGLKTGDAVRVRQLGFLFGLIEIGRVLFSMGHRFILQYLGQRLMFDLRATLFSHLGRLPMRFYDRNPTGRLVTRVTNDVANLSELFSSGLVTIASDAMVLLGISGLLVWLDWRLAMAVLGAIPFLIVMAWFFKVRLREAFRNVRERIARVNAALAEHVSGMRIIQAFNLGSERSQRFAALNADHRDAQFESVFYHSFFMPCVTVVNALTMAIILLYGGILVNSGRLTLGVMISFLAYAQHFFHPIRSLSEHVTTLQSALASAERIFTLLDEPEESPTTTEKVLVSPRGEICFEGVTFGYEPGRPVLHDVRFTIAPGESVAVVGHTGAGKTTLTALLNRFYDIEQGRITIDGHDVRSLDRTALRRTLGVIQQDVCIFAGTVLENIRLWNDAVSRETVERTAKIVGAHTFIERLPNGYDTELYERGGNLSAGQRQLLAFTRTMVADPRLLVLDEATAAIDSETEKLIQAAIYTLTAGRTSLIIAHRLSTIRHCVRILVFHQGRLAEQGTHEELLARRGLYWQLYEIQFAEPIKGPSDDLEKHCLAFRSGTDDEAILQRPGG